MGRQISWRTKVGGCALSNRYAKLKSYCYRLIEGTCIYLEASQNHFVEMHS